MITAGNGKALVFVGLAGRCWPPTWLLETFLFVSLSQVERPCRKSLARRCWEWHWTTWDIAAPSLENLGEQLTNWPQHQEQILFSEKWFSFALIGMRLDACRDQLLMEFGTKVLAHPIAPVSNWRHSESCRSYLDFVVISYLFLSCYSFLLITF